jgi:hypothetical protein
VWEPFIEVSRRRRTPPGRGSGWSVLRSIDAANLSSGPVLDLRFTHASDGATVT